MEWENNYSPIGMFHLHMATFPMYFDKTKACQSR